MASPSVPGTAVAKPLENITAIQNEIDALKETNQDQFPVDSAVLKGMSTTSHTSYRHFDKIQCYRKILNAPMGSDMDNPVGHSLPR